MKKKIKLDQEGYKVVQDFDKTKIIQGQEYKVLEVRDYGEYTITFLDQSHAKYDPDRLCRLLAELLVEEMYSKKSKKII